MDLNLKDEFIEESHSRQHAKISVCTLKCKAQSSILATMQGSLFTWRRDGDTAPQSEMYPWYQ
ncbi:hypothetical protein ANCCAN_15107 [Ancylostoma caninum]|uniref:Uncharacterized protein n=1 Tax=Ancylostoma caninum TaxID=29170 RepID=A0A368G3H6_ANCCA|nr:hypothetical protein ANCCAN_15107 [Ancylostoma caninum]